MGIKNLNRFLSDNCTKKSVRKQHLRQFKGKTLAIDTSIYMYKYQTENLLIENMDQLIIILLKYGIIPIFVFDGKPPPEKKELIQQRSQQKKEAEMKYNELLQSVNSDTDLQVEDKSKELTDLKKQFVRIRDTDIVVVKQLIDKYNILYIDAPEEADQLCAVLVKTKKAWACLSDDMDMFVYGCDFILRNLNLTQHTVIFYDMQMILTELEMSMTVFREIMVLSGTDYNIHSKTSLEQTINWLYKYNRYTKQLDANLPKKPFYEWLVLNTNYIDNYDGLKHIYSMFIV